MHIVCDFDGTITLKDTTDCILADLADPSWEAVERLWLSGRITAAECMRRQIAMIGGSDDDLNAVLDRIELDPDFADFAAWCAQRAVPIAIVSDGVDRFIEPILARNSLAHLPVVANQLAGRPLRRRLKQPWTRDGCAAGSGVCKCAAAARAEEQAFSPMVYIGDGRSDFCVSARADVLFAKGQLADYAAGRGQAFHAFDTFADVTRILARLVADDEMPTRAAGGTLITFEVPMFDAPTPETLSETDLKRLEAEYCSWGDTVHYMPDPKYFTGCDGAFMYDAEGREFLDLQMWYSAVNFGYRNRRLNEAAHRQLDRLPQVASQYLHREKVELAAMIAQDMEGKFGEKGRVHFNVGGAQAVEDSLKIVRNACGGKQLMFAFEGGYHGRTLGASAITSSYRYRRRFGHFGDRAQFVEFPYHFRGPRGMSKEEYGSYCVQKFARLFETEYNGVLDTKTGQVEYAAFYIEPIQGTGGYVIPPPNFFIELKKVLDQHGILLVVDEIQMGVYRTGKMWSIEHFGVTPDVLVFGKAITNGLNPLSGLWAKEALINPTIFPPGSTHSTFNSNPMGTAVALEALKMLSEGDYAASVAAKGAYFLDGLRDLQKRWPQIGDVDGLGLALRAEICQADGFTPNKALLDAIAEEGMKGDIDIDGRKYGLILDVGGYYKNVITFAPSLEITTAEIDLAIRLLDALMARCASR